MSVIRPSWIVPLWGLFLRDLVAPVVVEFRLLSQVRWRFLGILHFGGLGLVYVIFTCSVIILDPIVINS